MRRLTLFLAGVAIVGNLAIAQDNRNDLRVMVVGLRFELNELIPESQTKKAMDAWK